MPNWGGEARPESGAGVSQTSPHPVDVSEHLLAKQWANQLATIRPE